MVTIDESFVDASAPNAGAIKNGRALVLKGKFTSLHTCEDGTLLFAVCQGSGKTPYRCSSDFIQPDKPVHRCSCPSRQFPCKHCLGLMYAYVQGQTFTVAEIPDDISSKRDKTATRQKNKKVRAQTPRKVNKKALAKKIAVQLEGLDLLQTLTHDLVRLGMGNTNTKTAAQIEQQAKQLGDAYLPGAQAALHGYTSLFSDALGRFDSERTSTKREAVFGEALDQLTRLSALIRQGRRYLEARRDNPELGPDTDSPIAAWLGHAWQLAELKEAGLVQADAELLQLAFHSHDDVARREFVDSGLWMNLGTGQLQRTLTYRPYRAAKYIKSEDSFFGVAQVPELCVYPGDLNPRVRWDGMVPRPPTAADYARVREHAVHDFDAAIKQVKSTLKAPLADRHPVMALAFDRIAQVDERLVMQDKAGTRLVFTDHGMREEPPSCHLLPMLPTELLQEQVLVVRFHHDHDARLLRVKPLSIVTAEDVVRFTL